MICVLFKKVQIDFWSYITICLHWHHVVLVAACHYVVVTAGSKES